MNGVSFWAGIKIVAGSFFYSINCHFQWLQCNCFLVSPSQYYQNGYHDPIYFSRLHKRYVFGMIRSRPCMSGSSLPDPGRTSHLLPYLVNPPHCCTQTFILYACSVALFYFLETHQRDGIKSQKHHTALEGGVQYYIKYQN